MIKQAALIFLIAFVLNLIWEKLQMPLYSVDVSGWEYWLLCIRASIWDAVIITGVYYVVDAPSKKIKYIMSVIILLCVAIFIEQCALIEGRWAYSYLMPTIFGIGLVPLIQLPLLALATYETVKNI